MAQVRKNRFAKMWGGDDQEKRNQRKEGVIHEEDVGFGLTWSASRGI